MREATKKSNTYIKIAIILIILFLGYFFIPFGQNNYSNTYKLRNTASNGEPIKLQFRNGFQYDKYKPPKKSTFMQQRMEDGEEDKNSLFWNQKK
ncbi:hypothetical protein [Arcobacter sp.]|uniref:hypothetical protein n=1 Tax=Arcobacter sp. TaxID=1872629 RepID=UPI003D0A8050